MINQGITFSKDGDSFSVNYKSPSRKISNLREEFNNDAVNISKKYGKVYIAFSSGVDSQIILRCFIDMKLDFEAVFLHIKGYNEKEYQQLLECQQFYGINFKIFELDADQYKNEWIESNNKNNVNSLVQYPFEYLSKNLEESWPLITQGKSEPAIIGTNSKNCSIYHNYYEAMELRFDLINRYRTVLDFPYSPESITSYYTDENLKTFVSTLKYFNSSEHSPSDILQYFNNYAKPFVKGKYFSKDILWFPKLNGTENYPEWLLKMEFNRNFRVSVPYWDLVNFLESTVDEIKNYSEWKFR